MGLNADLESQVKTILRSTWSRRDGKVVPDDKSIGLGNDAVDLDATVLYADLRGSTAMVEGWKDWFAAEVYKSFLYCAARIIAAEAGTVTAYDGDRIMAVFIGGSRNTSAVRAAMKIHRAVEYVIQPAINNQYTKNTFVLKHTVGVDTSKLMVAKTGARGANDLVWVGRAANYAAKLTELSGYPTYITDDVYRSLNQTAITSPTGQHMWNELVWNDMGNRKIWGSNFWWELG